MLQSSSEAAGAESAYAAAVRVHGARHARLDSAGFESILLCVGDRIVKIYRPSLLNHMPAAAALAFFAARLEQLRIFAPSADARLLAMLPDGALSEDPRLPAAVGWAISLRRGTPFIDARGWADPTRRAKACDQLAAALEGRHRASKRLARGRTYEQLLHALLPVLDRHRSGSWGAVASPARIAQLTNHLAAAAGGDGDGRLGHGDLGLDNVILIDGELQFIDAGFALLEGAGLGGDPVLDGVMWDLACIDVKLNLAGEADCAKAFLDAYGACTGGEGLGDSPRRSWRILVLVAFLAATARQLPLIARDFGPARAGSAQQALRTLSDLLDRALGRVEKSA